MTVHFWQIKFLKIEKKMVYPRKKDDINSF